METASLATENAKLAALVKKCEADGPVIVTRRGKPVAVLVAAPTDEDDFDKLILTYSPQFWEMLERARKSFDEGKGLTSEEFWSEVAKRAEARKKAKVPASRTKKAVHSS